MACNAFNSAIYWRTWLVTLAVLLTKPLLCSTNPVADGSSKLISPSTTAVDAYFDELFKGIKDLAVAVASDKITSSVEFGNTRRNRRRIVKDDFAFEAPTICSLTELELNEITDLLETVGNDRGNTTLSCEIKQSEPSIVSLIDSPQRCSRRIDSIVINLKDIKNAFHCLSKPSDTYSRAEIETNFEIKTRQLTKRLENAEEEFGQKFKRQFEDLQRLYQKVVKEMKEAVDEKNKAKQDYLKAHIKLIVELLENGKIQSAWDEFNNQLMATYNNTLAIVERAIHKEFGANVPIKNVIKFMGGLKDNVEAMLSGFIIIFNELEKRQGFDKGTVEVLHITINDIIKQCMDLEGSESEESQLTLTDDMIDQLILVYNKIEFLKSIHG